MEKEDVRPWARKNEGMLSGVEGSSSMALSHSARRVGISSENVIGILTSRECFDEVDAERSDSDEVDVKRLKEFKIVFELRVEPIDD